MSFPLQLARTVWGKLRTIDPGLAAVVGLAAALRWTYIGMYHLVNDETSVMLAAFRLARQGQWTWRALNTTTWRFVPYHSPLSVYLAAIPYLFSPDPRLVRLWVASLGIAAVGLTYWTVRRYFGRTTAVLAGLLLAAHAPLVDWSRYGWNANYAPPFIAAWLLTGLVGYFEMKPRAQSWHWLALSGAIQAHPATIVLAPLTLFQVAAAWVRDRPARPALVRATLLGWLLFAASMAPWGIGLVTAPPLPTPAEGLGDAASQVLEPAVAFDAREMVRNYNDVIGSVGRRLNPALYSKNGLFQGDAGPGEWWPPAWIETIFRAQAALSLAAMLALLLWGVRRRTHLPALVLAVLGLWPFVIFRFTPTPHVEPWYLMAPIFGAVPALAVTLGWAAARNRWLRLGAFALTGVFVASQAWLTIATMRNHYLAGIAGRFDAPLDSYLSTLDAWQTAAGGREVIIFTEKAEGKRTAYVQQNDWTIAAAGRPVRIVSMDPPQGVPIPAGGAVFAGTPAGDTIPELFGQGSTIGRLPDGEPMYRWTLATSVPDVGLRLYPENVSLFASGARLLGLGYDQAPQPGQPWPVTLLWRVDSAPPREPYSFSLRLAAAPDGARFGQVDGPSLAAGLWRAGDTVINRFNLPVGSDYPAGASPPQVQVWMYGAQPAGVLDDRGAYAAAYVTLAPAGAVDQLGWFRFDAYGRYEALTSHPFLARLAGQIDLLGFAAPRLEVRPNEAVPVTLYWEAAQPPALDYRVFVHLRADDGSLRGQSDKVSPAGIVTSHWTVGRYVVDQHSLRVAPDTAPGQYRLFVGLWDGASGQRAPAVDENGAPLGDSAPLPVLVTVTS